MIDNKPGLTDDKGDSELVKAILAGRKDLFAEIAARYQNRIFGMAWSYTRNYEEASDITQDVLIAVYGSLARFDTSRSLTGWVIKIAVHHCYQYLRKKKRPAKRIDSPTEFPDPLEVQIQNEQKSKALEAFYNLENELKMTVWLFYFLDRSCREISEILEISVDLVKVRLFRARKSMGDAMKSTDLS